MGTPNDEYFAEQWNLGPTKLQMEQAWDITTGNEEVVIAIIDNGVDYNHPDLFHNIWENEAEDRGTPGVDDDDWDDDPTTFIDDYVGWDFFWNDNDPISEGGLHGNLVAGIACAMTSNWDEGISGVAGGWFGEVPMKRGCLMMILKVGEWEAYDFYTADAIDYATNTGAKVINISLGWETGIPELEDAVNSAVANDIVVVAAAGDWCLPDCTLQYPARYPNVIAVGATDSSDVRQVNHIATCWPYFFYTSSRGDSSSGIILDLVAPSDVWSTDEQSGIGCSLGHYTNGFAGTSAAAPHVAGVVGLIKSVDSNLTWYEVRDILRYTADKVAGMGGQDYTDEYGFGRLNAFRAVMKAKYDAEVVDCFIQEDTTWPTSSFFKNVYFEGDVTVSPGKTLTINPGTIIYIDNVDHQNNGIDSARIELNVEGRLEAVGTSENPIVFQTWSEVTPSKLDWVGIYFDNASSGGDLEYRTIKHAEYAIETYVPVTIDYCAIDSVDYCGVVAQGGNILVQNSTISNSDAFGIFLESSTVTLINCLIDNNYSVGVELNGFDTLYAYGTTFSNSDKGLILNNGAIATVDSNCTFEHNDIGVSIYQSSNIGIKNSTIKDNTTDGIYCNHLGYAAVEGNNIQYNGAGIFCYDRSSPLIKGNTITYNADGVFAAINSNPDIGHHGVSGNNSIHHSTNFHVVNLTPGITIMAEDNWWGSNRGPKSSKIIGYVDYVPWLAAPPTVSAWEVAEDSTTTDKRIPSVFAISRIFPNPFNPSTSIHFQVPEPGGRVRIAIYNVAGQIVKVLLNEYMSPGYQNITWDGVNEKGQEVSSSVYFVNMSANNFRETKKIVLLK